jgi:cell division protein FtsI/penicillin-binding protein 2
MYINSNIKIDNLILTLDPANVKCYSGGTNFYDVSSGINATLINSPTFSSENSGIFKFSGYTVGDYININGIQNYISGTNLNLSIIIWVRLNVYTYDIIFMGSNNNTTNGRLYFSLNADGNWGFGFGNKSLAVIDGGVQISANSNVWTHLCLNIITYLLGFKFYGPIIVV